MAVTVKDIKALMELTGVGMMTARERLLKQITIRKRQ